MKPPHTNDDQKKFNILISLQFIGLQASAIDIETQLDLTDIRFKNPILNNHIRRIKESTKVIETHLASYAKKIDRDEFDYNHAVEYHRTIKHFSGLSAEQLKKFMDGVDEQLKAITPS